MKVEFGHLLNVTADESWREKHGEEGADFCRILFIDGIYYIFVSIHPGGSQNYYSVRGFDQDWQFTGFEKRLTPETVRDIDQDIAFDGENIYQYASRVPYAQGGGGQIRKFDKEFNLIKQTSIFTSENERITDHNIAVFNGKIYAGSEYRENEALWREKRMKQGSKMQNIPPNSEVARATHLRVFDTDLNILEERDLIANIEGAEVSNQYWGLGASQLYAEGYHCVVAASPIGNTSYFDRGESIGARQIFISRFDANFHFVDSKGPLTDTNNDNLWCTGSLYENGRYYITYCVRRPGEGCQPGPGGRSPQPRKPRVQRLDASRRPRADFPRPKPRPELSEKPRELGVKGCGNILLSIFDDNFKELKTVPLTYATAGKGSAGNRPGLLKIGNKLFITYDSDQKSYVQELTLRT